VASHHWSHLPGAIWKWTGRTLFYVPSYGMMYHLRLLDWIAIAMRCHCKSRTTGTAAEHAKDPHVCWSF
jgi:hypothetical protein